jgi:hypothetical protein
MEPTQPHEPTAPRAPGAPDQPTIPGEPKGETTIPSEPKSEPALPREPKGKPTLAREPQDEPRHRRESRTRAAARRLAGWIVPRDNPAGAVYGLVTVGALLAAESSLRETYPETVGSVALAMVLYWFAHSYSDVLGLRLVEDLPFSWRKLYRTFAHDWAIAKGASVPLLALLVAWAAGASQVTALTAAVWCTVVSLIAFEMAAGIRARAKPLELLLEALVGATMGVAILALRALLH